MLCAEKYRIRQKKTEKNLQKNAKVIDNLIPLEEIILDVKRTIESKTIIEYFFVITNKQLWVLNKNEFKTYEFEAITCFNLMLSPYNIGILCGILLVNLTLSVIMVFVLAFIPVLVTFLPMIFGYNIGY